MDAPSVESLCNALVRGKLVPAEEVRSLYQRWSKESGQKNGDLDRFSKWLIANQVATEYQLGVVLRGNTSQLFLNQYTILERVGKGRLAGVYKATHRLGQTVAIKVLPPSKAKDEKILQRFRREARLAIKLKHPNIVRTFQTGRFENLNYLVMELLEGETLDDVFKRRGPLPPTEAVRLIHEALLGLHHIHEEGLIHRDMKPGNLMLIPGGGDTTVADIIKILDIGTGRDLFEEGKADYDLTKANDVLGTPEYMAPEQARDPHKADIRSDIYTLGCVLFHALAGRPPYTDSNAVRLLVKHATEPIPSVRKFNPKVPEGLEQILGWMLAKDPKGRYPTPERAAQALQVYLAADHQSSQVIADPRMAAYLKWLGSQKAETTDEEPVIPQAIPVKAPAPIAQPVPLQASPVNQDYDVEPIPPPKPASLKKPSLINSTTVVLIVAIVVGILLVGCAGIIGAALLLWASK